jgi:hypothetical protein
VQKKKTNAQLEQVLDSLKEVETLKLHVELNENNSILVEEGIPMETIEEQQNEVQGGKIFELPLEIFEDKVRPLSKKSSKKSIEAHTFEKKNKKKIRDSIT